MLVERKKTRLQLGAKENVVATNKLLNPLTLRQKRSSKFIKMLGKLDVGHSTLNQTELEDLIQGLKQEFPIQDALGSLQGIVAKCYLGKEYEVHMLDMKLDILRHYKFNESLPPELQKARSLANNTFYEYIEVYTDCLCAVKSDGSVSVIGRE